MNSNHVGRNMEVEDYLFEEAIQYDLSIEDML